MKFLQTLAAVLLGSLAGAAISRSQPAKAAAEVYVQQVAVGVHSPIQGTNVVGFSCAGSGGTAACYVATQ